MLTVYNMMIIFVIMVVVIGTVTVLIISGADFSAAEKLDRGQGKSTTADGKTTPITPSDSLTDEQKQNRQKYNTALILLIVSSVLIFFMIVAGMFFLFRKKPIKSPI